LSYNFYRKESQVKRLSPLLLVALAACATTDPPEAEMTAARAMVAQARPAGQTAAPMELAQAEGKLARAEVAMQRGHNGQAKLLAEQAEADARLAWTISENARAQAALRQEVKR
jgi:hypothetical protein